MNGFDLKPYLKVWSLNIFAWYVTLSHVQELLGILATLASLIFTLIKIYKEFRNGKRG